MSIGCGCGALTTQFDDLQDGVLNVPHDGVGPEARIGIEVGGEALAAEEVEATRAVRERFEAIFAFQNVEVWTADGYVLIEGGWRNCVGVRLDAEGEVVESVPVVDGFGEDKPSGKRCVADAADSFMRERCGDWTREAYAPCPRRRQF